MTGRLPSGDYTKDVTFEMVRKVGVDGANYRAIEYTGELVEQMSVSERFTICNMAIEMGGKAGLVAPDAMTRAWLRGRIDRDYPMLAPCNPRYERVVEIDASELSPLIACPPDVNNVVPVEEVEQVKIDQVFLGTCTNGRLDDLAIAANIMRGKTLHPHTRMVVVPASREVYLEAMRLGYLETFVRAGASVENAGCGPCIGRHQGVLAPGEHALTTMNRNFTGRMGDPTAEIYLGSPAAILASGVQAVIARSFARIFYRNAVNIGLPALVCEEAVLATDDGHHVEVDLESGLVHNLTTGRAFQAEPLTPFVARIVAAGGILEYIRQEGTLR